MAATTTFINASDAGGAGRALARWRGNRTRVMALISFDITSYTTNGETLPTAAALDMTSISAVIPVQTSATATGYIFVWDSTNGKLIVNTATGAQATSTAATGPVTLLVIGY